MFSLVSVSLVVSVGLVFTPGRETGSFALETEVFSNVTGAVGVSVTSPLVVRLESAGSTCVLDSVVDTASSAFQWLQKPNLTCTCEGYNEGFFHH